MLHKEEQGCDKECCPSQFFKLFLDFVFCFNWAPCISTFLLFVVMLGPRLLFFNLLWWSCIVHFFLLQKGRSTRMWITSFFNIFLFSTFIFCLKWALGQVAFPFCVFYWAFVFYFLFIMVVMVVHCVGVPHCVVQQGTIKVQGTSCPPTFPNYHFLLNTWT
jgi:hypothetical protein